MSKLVVYTSGYLITEPLDGSPAIIEETIQCVHCQRHVVYRPKTFHKDFAFCLCCYGPVCNKPECALRCVPSEQWLENVEQGKPEDHRNIIVTSGYSSKDDKT